MVVVLFLLAFGVGPALFFGLDRRAERPWLLVVFALVLVVASFFLRGMVFNFDTTGLVLSVVCVWMAWVLVMVLAARALRQILASYSARRFVRVAGAIGTTIPWFGFAAAQWMAT